jgi:hypothetical protein
MFALLIVVKILVPAVLTFSPRLIELVRLENLGFLLLFLIVSLTVTIFMPRLLSGAIDIIPLKVVKFAATETLEPSLGNLTQSIYLCVSVAVTFATALMARSPRFPDALLFAVLVGGLVLFGSGLADMAASAVGQSALLDPFRNASYAMITNAEVVGMRRVVGLMPEASSYGSTCIAFGSTLIFLRPLYGSSAYRMAASLTAVALVGMALLSTSSSAYAGIAMFSAAYALNVARRLASGSTIAQTGLALEFFVGFVALMGLLLVLLLQPETFDPLLRLVDEIIFNKASSDSFLERSFWNQVGWNAAWSTYGMGVGLGSTRASNYFVAVISNTGFFGATFFFIFLIQTFFRRSYTSPKANEMVSALKFAIVPSLGMAALGSATPDFEPWLALIFGAIAGLALKAPSKVPAERYVGMAGYGDHAVRR